MAYLVLPSSRLLALTIDLKITLLPIRCDEIALLNIENQHILATSYLKTVSLFNTLTLNNPEAQQITPFSSSNFNKKLEGLCHNRIDSFFASDKFGDIYSIDLKGQVKYLNSNLGIPTFLQFIKSSKGSFIAVGDQDTRVKIYNQKRMHEIMAFWFFAKRLPLSITQLKDESLLLVLKKQSGGAYQEEESWAEIYHFTNDQIRESEFGGKLVYKSADIEQGKQCKHQLLLTVNDNTILLIKLFSTFIRVVEFEHTEGISESKTHKVAIEQGEWDYLSATLVGHLEGKYRVALSIGKSYTVDESTPLNLVHLPLKQNQCRINDQQFVLVLQQQNL